MEKEKQIIADSTAQHSTINYGNYYGHGSGFAGTVWGTSDLSPTIMSRVCSGGMGLIVERKAKN